jgi:hypothetical protein
VGAKKRGAATGLSYMVLKICLKGGDIPHLRVNASPLARNRKAFLYRINSGPISDNLPVGYFPNAGALFKAIYVSRSGDEINQTTLLGGPMVNCEYIALNVRDFGRKLD